MRLEDAKDLLEHRGFDVVEETPSIVVGYKSECRCYLHSKFDTMILVHRVPVHQTLNLDRIHGDLQQIPTKIQEHYVGGCPPFGFARARLIIVVYLVEGSIDPAAVYRLTKVAPESQFCQAVFLAAQDGEGNPYFLNEGRTPFWGRALYPELRYWAALFTGGQVGKFPSYTKLAFVNVLALIVVTLQIVFNQFGQLSLLFLVAFIGIHFLLSLFMQWYRQRRSNKESTPPHLSALSNEMDDNDDSFQRLA